MEFHHNKYFAKDCTQKKVKLPSYTKKQKNFDCVWGKKSKISQLFWIHFQPKLLQI